jgi:hypothetical protein
MEYGQSCLCALSKNVVTKVTAIAGECISYQQLKAYRAGVTLPYRCPGRT